MINQFGAVYLSHVPIIRAKDYHFLNKPHFIDVVAAGSYLSLTLTHSLTHSPTIKRRGGPESACYLNKRP